ncbi:MAG: hypothetical protein R3185_02055 [Candidatus Thermoplasmatota archaeon]|nr:hypothetical protein [Candidatus Thermoplasmatota archaeon]
MHRAWIALPLVLIALTPGCLEDLVDAPNIEASTPVSRLVTFSYPGTVDPSAPPSTPEEAYQAGSYPFDLAPGALRLTVQASVEFQRVGSLDAGEELREVTITLTRPGGEVVGNLTTSQSEERTWAFQEPAPGTWEITYRARGQGSIFLQAHTLHQVDR